MALAADREVVASGRTEILRGVLTAGVIYYKGGIVALASGLIVKAANTAGYTPIGVLKAGTRGVVAVTGQQCEIERGKLWIPLAAGAQTDVDDFVYATADDTIAKTATDANPCGRVVDYKLWGNSLTDKRLLVDFRQGLPKTALA